VEVFEGSADSTPDMVRALDGVDTVLHVAHIRFAPTLIAAMTRRGGTYRFVALSSTRVLSRFATPLRELVRAGEETVRAAPATIRWTILREAMIFGWPGDRNIGRMADWVRRHRFVPLFGSGRNLVQPLFVLDLVAAIEACLERPVAVGHTYTLAGPEAMTWRDMVRAVARAVDAPRPVFVRLSYGASLRGARVLRRLWPAFPLDPEVVERFGEDRSFSILPACRDLGFSPTPFEQALDLKFRGEG